MTSQEKRYFELSWKILGYKLMYYHPEKVNKKYHKELTITDSEYDALEAEYMNLCKELYKGPTATEMVGFDLSRASCRLVLGTYKCKSTKLGVSE